MTLIGEHYSDFNHYLDFCVSITGFLTIASVKRGVLLFQEACRECRELQELE